MCQLGHISIDYHWFMYYEYSTLVMPAMTFFSGGNIMMSKYIIIIIICVYCLPRSTLQFHADYLKQSRSYLWEQCLEPVLNSDITHERWAFITLNFLIEVYTCDITNLPVLFMWRKKLRVVNIISLSSLRHLIEEFEMRLGAGGKSHSVVKAVDSKFRKSIQEQQVRYSKVLLHTVWSAVTILVHY